jgi:hypothetical protein
VTSCSDVDVAQNANPIHYPSSCIVAPTARFLDRAIQMLYLGADGAYADVQIRSLGVLLFIAPYSTRLREAYDSLAFNSTVK